MKSVAKPENASEPCDLAYGRRHMVMAPRERSQVQWDGERKGERKSGTYPFSWHDDLHACHMNAVEGRFQQGERLQLEVVERGGNSHTFATPNKT